jgi:type IV pilus assembly protein PilX
MGTVMGIDAKRAQRSYEAYQASGLSGARQGQRGIVLFIALIVLVAMTLAGIATVRSVDTTNQIAGNLAFKQSATMGADAAVEAARTWVLTQTAAGALFTNSTANGYYSFAPTSGPGIETDWTSYDWTASSRQLTTADVAGNDIRYVIHRMCNQTGDPSALSGITCNTTLSSGASSGIGSSKGAGRVSLIGLTQYYYRITVRVIGPRNTTSYVQAMIEL